MEEGACLAVKNIGKPCAGEPQARFDEGRLMDEQPGRHVVAARGEASVKVPATGLISASYSTRNSQDLSRHDERLVVFDFIHNVSTAVWL